jgi:hypothetical protein
MIPYVEQFGISDTIKKLHLHSDFAKMYELQLDKKTLKALDSMITSLCDNGARSSVPLSLFVFISKIDDTQLSTFMASLGNMIKESSRYFRWPHNVYLRKLEIGDNDTIKPATKKLPPPEIKFCCDHCKTNYVVSEGIVNEQDHKSEKNLVIQHKTDSIPQIVIPSEFVEHLHISATKLPKIISSADVNEKDLISYLMGKNFVIVLGENRG